MSAALYPNPVAILRPRGLHSFPIARNGIRLSHLSNPQSRQNELRLVMGHTTTCRWRIRVFPSGEGIDVSPRREVAGDLSLDAFLSFAEVVFIVPPAIHSLGCAAGMLIPGTIKPFHLELGNKVFVCQFVLLVCAVVVGALIRRRQWGRICRKSAGASVDLLARIEKVEDDLRSSSTIIRVLSRQLEKLGIRFRVTRKALKEPITETAVLAQKNSEAISTLAMQEDILEKELCEIQKVLLAMQEQQQKQLELILAISQAGRVLEDKGDATAPTGGGKIVSNSVPGRKVHSLKRKQEKRKVNNLNMKQEEDTAEANKEST